MKGKLMKNNAKTLLALVLVFIMVVALFASCTPTETTESTPATSTPETSTETSVDPNAPLDDLPERDFGGEDFVIYSREETEYEFLADELNEEFINDKIYERNAAVEERFKVKIKTKSEPGGWGMHEEFINSVRTQINGGTADFDVIAGYAAIIPSVVAEGLFYNWYDIENIDFNKSYWSQDLIKQLTINGKMFLLTGDASLTMWQSMQGIYFNKLEAQNSQIGDLYQMVYDKQWTFDKMAEICKDVTRNEDGVDTWTDQDFYGYLTAKTVQVDVYLDAFNIPVTTKSDDGLVFTVNQAKTHNALFKLHDFINVSNSSFSQGFDGAEDSRKMFAEGKGLFTPDSLQAGETLKNYDIEYGILPMPLYDENQEKYNTTCQDYFSLFVIPNTTQDTEFIGFMMEALCSESSKNVVNQYYETILKSRYTHDDDSKNMIDIIREGVLFNFGYLYSYSMDWPAHQLNICINEGSTGFEAKWQANESKFKANLEKVLAPYYD